MESGQAPTVSDSDTAAQVPAAIAGWGSGSLSPAAQTFVRGVVASAAPGTRARAKALLFAAGKLAYFGEAVGLELTAGVLLHPSVIERFTLTGTGGVSPATRRTLRTNLRALARALERYPPPAPVPLARERAKRPYSPAQIAGYLRLAGAQRTLARRMRASALICLGAGAGVIGAELRHLTGPDVVSRSGGLLVVVGGPKARTVAVLERYHQPLQAAAAFAGDSYLLGGRAPQRRNLTDALTAALCSDAGAGAPGRRAAQINLAGRVRAADRARGVHARRRDHLQPAAGGSRRAAAGALRDRAGRTAGRIAVNAKLARLEAIIDSSGVARQVERLLPIGVRPRQLSVRTLLTGMLLVAIHGRPAHLRRVHRALLALSASDQQRLAIITQWRTGPHLLSYRQVERTFALLTRALAKPTPDGTPSERLSDVLDRLLEASVTVLGEPASSSYAVDWTDHETWSRPPRKPGAERSDDNKPATDDTEPPTPDSDSDSDSDSDDDRRCADPEASWGHRRGHKPGQKDEAFYGYYPPSRHHRAR